MLKTFLFAVHRVERKDLGNSAVSVNADERKTACDMVGWVAQRKGSLQRMRDFQNNMQNHTKDFKFTPATHSGCPQVSSAVFPTTCLGTTGWLHVFTAHPTFGVGSTLPEIPLFFALAQKTQICSH